MLEAVLSDELATCIPQGTQAPMDQIAAAANTRDVDVIALSFSSAYTRREAVTRLTEMRVQL